MNSIWVRLNQYSAHSLSATSLLPWRHVIFVELKAKYQSSLGVVENDDDDDDDDDDADMIFDIDVIGCII